MLIHMMSCTHTYEVYYPTLSYYIDFMCSVQDIPETSHGNLFLFGKTNGSWCDRSATLLWPPWNWRQKWRRLKKQHLGIDRISGKVGAIKTKRNGVFLRFWKSHFLWKKPGKYHGLRNRIYDHVHMSWFEYDIDCIYLKIAWYIYIYIIYICLYLIQWSCRHVATCPTFKMHGFSCGTMSSLVSMMWGRFEVIQRWYWTRNLVHHEVIKDHKGTSFG